MGEAKVHSGPRANSEMVEARGVGGKRWKSIGAHHERTAIHPVAQSTAGHSLSSRERAARLDSLHWLRLKRRRPEFR